MTDVPTLLRWVTGLSFGALCLLVIGVGAVSFVAELYQTWTWYFRMEEVIATATPVAIALLGITISGAIGTVFSIPKT